MNTPNFGRMGVVDEEQLGAARAKLDTLMQDVEADLEQRGILDAPRPDNHPKALADLDITLLTNNELASLYSQYVAYGAYIGDGLAKVEGLEEAAKRFLRDVLSELKEAQFVKGMKGAEATSAALQDPLYKDYDLEHTKLFLMKTIMKRRYDGYKDQAAALSRSIELRKLDFEQSSRDNNLGYPGKRAAPHGFGRKSP